MHAHFAVFVIFCAFLVDAGATQSRPPPHLIQPTSRRDQPVSREMMEELCRRGTLARHYIVNFLDRYNVTDLNYDTCLRDHVYTGNIDAIWDVYSIDPNQPDEQRKIMFTALWIAIQDDCFDTFQQILLYFRDAVDFRAVAASAAQMNRPRFFKELMKHTGDSMDLISIEDKFIVMGGKLFEIALSAASQNGHLDFIIEVIKDNRVLGDSWELRMWKTVWRGQMDVLDAHRDIKTFSAFMDFANRVIRYLNQHPSEGLR